MPKEESKGKLKKSAQSLKEEEAPAAPVKSKQSGNGKGSPQILTDPKDEVANQDSKKNIEQPLPNPKEDKSNKMVSKDEKVAPKAGLKKVVNKKVETGKAKANKKEQSEQEKDIATKEKTTLSKKGKSTETTNVKDGGNKGPVKKILSAKKNQSSDPVPAHVSVDAKKTNKNEKPTSTLKKAANPTIEAKQNESETTPKGVKRKHEEVFNNSKEKADSKKAKPALSKKRTRANAPSTRSINIKGVESQNIVKAPTKKKSPIKAPADDITTTPASQNEKQEKPAKATKNDAKRVKVDNEISFTSPKVSKTTIEKPAAGKKGNASKIDRVEEGSPVMKLLQAAGRRLGILKK